eukprot:CAMPEP_0197077198 /NCGR_PEP_ID=MMETSP1384-20130603/212496_1 /TAXON_ID=29189 /ORGANISM="Ammonia sp." /LENGTH=578 /DNA_ID=CAMNT_0042516059 /DNA_START=46 /DNA_END=1782 /DNA_ORIENTATION=-
MPKTKRTGEEDKVSGTSPTANAEDLSTVTFKYPGRYATLTRNILVSDTLTVKDLTKRVPLCISQPPPDAKKVFELYYMDEIFPFINKHAQESLGTRKSIEKTWDLQTAHFQKIYTKRAELLRQKWQDMKNKKGNSHTSTSSTSSSTTSLHAYQPYDPEQDKQSTSPTASTPKHPHENSTTVIFKYYSVHSSAKTNRHIFITPPSKQELVDKIGLSLQQTPPSAKELFEIYYYDEILPFLKKSGQQSIRGKKDLGKVWQIQTKTFKNLYEDRSKILTEEWLAMKKAAKEERKKKLKKEKEQRKLERARLREQREYERQQAALLKDEESNAGTATTPSLTPKQACNEMNGAKSKVSFAGKAGEEACASRKVECSLIRTLLNFLLFIECTTKENCAMLLIADQKRRHAEYSKFEKYLRRIAKSPATSHELVYLHLRVYIDNFDADHLRLHTGKQVIKLCFVNNFFFESTIKRQEEEDGEQDSLSLDAAAASPTEAKLAGNAQEVEAEIGGDRQIVDEVQTNVEQRNEREKLKQPVREEELILFELEFNKLITGLDDKIDHEHIEAHLDDETRILSINVPLL